MAEYTLHACLDMSLMAVCDGLLRRGHYLGAGQEYPSYDAGYDQDQKANQPGAIHFNLFVDRLEEKKHPAYCRVNGGTMINFPAHDVSL